FILNHSLKQQIFLLVLTFASFPFLYYSLDLPKTIVNKAIGGKQFPERLFRYSLYLRLLRFPLSYFQKNSSAQIIPMITVECEQLGGFIGDAFVTPLFQGGQLLTMLIFMFMQDPILGAAAIALYPIQAYIIPKLQFKVNQLGKQRVRTVRQVADRVQESAGGLIRSEEHT